MRPPDSHSTCPWCHAAGRSQTAPGDFMPNGLPDSTCLTSAHGRDGGFREQRIDGAGYLARPAGDRPGVLVVQEWWGLDATIKEMADRLAAGGFTALVSRSVPR